jgi:hypothetical protein
MFYFWHDFFFPDEIPNGTTGAGESKGEEGRMRAEDHKPGKKKVRSSQWTPSGRSPCFCQEPLEFHSGIFTLV